MLVLVILQFMVLVGQGLAPGWHLLQPTLILAPVAAVTGACGFAFALHCARSSKTGIVLLGIAIGVFWGIGADVAGTLIASGTDAFAHRPPARLLLQTVKVSASIVPIALIECMLVRRYGRRGADNVPRATA